MHKTFRSSCDHKIMHEDALLALTALFVKYLENELKPFYFLTDPEGKEKKGEENGKKKLRTGIEWKQLGVKIRMRRTSKRKI